jgi:predicted permease
MAIRRNLESWLSWFPWYRRQARDADLERELRDHLELEADEHTAAGLSPEQAAFAAHRAFGNTMKIEEDVRAAWGFQRLETLVQDLHYGLRILRKSPGFTAVAVLTLALGIGANTAIFSLVNAVMLQSLPVRSPEELVAVGNTSHPTGLAVGGPMTNLFSYPLYQQLRVRNTVFSGLLASGRALHTDIMIGKAHAEEVHSRLVSGNYFDVLGVSPFLGSMFSSEADKTAGASPFIVISCRYWKERFGSNPGVLGSTVSINGTLFTIIGVAPKNFHGEVVGSPTDVWIPITMQGQVDRGDPRLNNQNANWILCLGRLKPGVPIDAARSQVNTIVHQVLIEYENAKDSPDKIREILSEPVLVQPGGDGFSWIRTHDAPFLYTLMVIVGLVLLIACVNVAGLLLARATTRQREIAIRVALGASQRRLIRQLLTESALLACVAGILGLLFVEWGSPLIARLASTASVSTSVPFDVDVHPDLKVFGFTAAISILTAIISGLIPSFRSARINLEPALKQGGTAISKSRYRIGKVFVVGQLALSVVLLIGAGLFLRNLSNLSGLNLGYSRDNLLVLSADLARSGYAPPRRLPIVKHLLEELRGVPGVAGATVSQNGLFNGTDSNTDGLRVEGFVPTRKDDSAAFFDQVGPNHFKTIGAQILRGRDFEDRDTAGAPPVAIINDTMARFYFGKNDPIGKYFFNGGDRYVIVGVAEDTQVRDLNGKPERRFYTPLYQTTDTIDWFNFEIRTFGPASSMTAVVAEHVQALDPSLRVGSLVPINFLIDQSIGPDRLIARLSALFGILALALAANGLYGLISYTTSQRTREIGLRMALGAQKRDVLNMVVGQGLKLALIGMATGIIGALGLTRFLSSLLYGVKATDPLTFIGVSLFFIAVALLASYVPARRAMHVDPMVALRYE